jgi:hypothetical protein
LSSAEVYLKDVPEGHWANESVYELVRMGVTDGYPDGTFRGRNFMDRYSLTTFTARMARYFNLKYGRDEKLVAELRSEAAQLKYQQEQEAREGGLTGELTARARGTTLTNRGGFLDYRLKLKLARNVDEDTGLRITLDTVDAGFATTKERPIATKLLDVESRFKLWGWKGLLAFGPGVVPHLDDHFPSENNLIYQRPKTSFTMSTEIDKLSVSGSYVTRAMAANGLIGVHELTGVFKYKYDGLAFYFQPRYLYRIDGPRDVLADFGVNHLWQNCLTQLLVSAGNFSEQANGLYVKFSEKISDPWRTGTDLYLRFDKVGSKYRVDDLDEYEFAYLNNFDRLILDGTVDLGFKLGQKLGERWRLEYISDLALTGDYQYGASYPGTYWLWQIGLNYAWDRDTLLSSFYQGYNVPSGIAQFDDPVPAFSEIIGLGLKYSF